MTLIFVARRAAMPFIASFGLLASGCVDAPDSGDDTIGSIAHVGTTLTTDQPSYSAGSSVLVTYAGMSGSATDWVALAAPGDADGTFSYWAYTGGGETGTMTFANVPAGTYEARAFYDWEGTSSFTVQSRSTTFQVGTSVSTSASTYAVGTPVVISFTGLPGTATDWVAIAAPGSSVQTFANWSYTSGASNGTVTLTGVPAGTYVARAFGNDSFNLAGESAPFTVGAGSVSVSTSNSTYTNTDSVVVNYAGLGGAKDWIAIATAGADPTDFGEWFYVPSASGTHTFAALAAGSYEVRAFYNDGFTLAASSTFTVTGGAGISAVAMGSDVSVSYTNAPGNAKDWVALSPVGSPASSYTVWAYINGTQNGAYSFAGVGAGQYVARVYENDTFTIVYESAPFTVAAGTPDVSTSESTYVAGAPAVVSYQGLPGNAKDWVAVAAAGSTDAEFLDWTYTGGRLTGSASFANLAAGTYEARVYENDTFTVLARSTFSVSAAP